MNRDPRSSLLLPVVLAATGAAAANTGEPTKLETIGPYRVGPQLGEGGMGRVVLASRDEDTQPVALKTIRHELLGDADVVTQFAIEREALAAVDHPNVVRLVDSDLERNEPFIVMEYVAGTPITEYCDARRLPLRDRVALFGQLCDGLDALHRSGVLHCDLKPANVLVTERSGAPVVKIIDLGVARHRPHRNLTQPSADGIAGTLAYMSPEQVTLPVDALDARSDVFSAGLILYELLAGVSPFGADLRSFDASPPAPSERVLEVDSAEELERIATTRQTTAAELVVALNGQLDRAVLRALAPERDERFGSARELARGLREDSVLQRVWSKLLG